LKLFCFGGAFLQFIVLGLALFGGISDLLKRRQDFDFAS